MHPYTYYNILFTGLTLAQQLAQLEDPTPIGSQSVLDDKNTRV